MSLNNVNVQENLEDAAMEVANNQGLSPVKKVLLWTGIGLLTVGFGVAAYFGYKGIKAKRAAKLAQASVETEQHE